MNTLLASLLLFEAAAAPAAAPNVPPLLQGIGIDQRLGASLPLDAMFTNGNGQTLPLSAYFLHRPVILALVYYTCPMLCGQTLSGIVAGLRPLSLRPGRDFDIVAISINPGETARDAAEKRDFYSQRYDPRAGTGGWHFLVGAEPAIRAVAEAAGFHYRYDTASQMYFHAAGIMIATPQGKLARYFYGVSFRPKDLELGLIEASGNRIGSPVDQILLFCYHYDPSVGKYGWAVINLLRGASVVFVIGLAATLFVMFRRDALRGKHGIGRVPTA
jgi:protein SCO1